MAPSRITAQIIVVSLFLLAFTRTGELLPAKPGTQDVAMLQIPEFSQCYQPQTARLEDRYCPFMFIGICD
jgi:hypothetical protein